MKVLFLGDRFITPEILKEAFEAKFGPRAKEYEYAEYQLQWPVVPMSSNDEVREFSGTDDEIIPLVADADIILTHTGCMTKKAIDAAKKLKVLALGRGSLVNVNLDACTARKIPVIYAPGRNSGAVADFTVAMMLAQSRNIALSHYYLRYKNEWRGDLYARECVGNELGYCTVGLVGFGAIGRKVAKMVHDGFGSKVMAYDPFISDEVKAQYPDYTFCDLDTLLKNSDFVSLHVKYTKDNAGMIGAREIGLMKPNAIFINTARPQLVDYDALYKALKEKKIAGAGLDVFEDEPPKPTSKLYELENVTATPHLGGASVQAAKIGASIAVSEVYDYIVDKKQPKFWGNKF
ncbi:MAG: 2-hydroxyacid dehydrogenase [Oscillospiraceae bacterium]|nr:2-hydroxyacid dehydrogenase [Oscillospiraceae bacterium]